MFEEEEKEEEGGEEKMEGFVRRSKRFIPMNFQILEKSLLMRKEWKKEDQKS